MTARPNPARSSRSGLALSLVATKDNCSFLQRVSVESWVTFSESVVLARGLKLSSTAALGFISNHRTLPHTHQVLGPSSFYLSPSALFCRRRPPAPPNHGARSCFAAFV